MATGIRTDWTREEISEIYNMPVLELVHWAGTVHRAYRSISKPAPPTTAAMNPAPPWLSIDPCTERNANAIAIPIANPSQGSSRHTMYWRLA